MSKHEELDLATIQKTFDEVKQEESKVKTVKVDIFDVPENEVEE